MSLNIHTSFLWQPMLIATVSPIPCLYVYLLFLNFYLFIYLYLFLAVLGLRFSVRAFSSCGEQGPLFITVHGPLTASASLVVEHKLQMHRLSSCGSRA